MIILQIPATVAVEKIGTRRSSILGNIFNVIYILIIIFAPNLKTLIIGEFVSAMCFSLKDISDTTLLGQSIPECSRKSEIFSRLEGKGSKYYYYLNSVTSVLAGFLYVINPYVPIVFALLIAILSVILSIRFHDVEEKTNKNSKGLIKDTRELIDGFKFVLKSNRLRSLILYSGIIWGTFCLLSTYRASLLEEIGMSAQVIAIISAVVGIASGIGADNQLRFHNYFKNKTLSKILAITSIMILIMGIAGITGLSPVTITIIITFTNIVIKAMQGIHGVVILRYLGNFASDQIISKIYAVNSISRNVFRMLIGFLGSYLLKITNTANSTLIFGILFGIISISLISYMSTRLGLKPEEYRKEDIEYK
jgi:MFS family permease